MSEQRQQAYLNLIQQLLNCRSDEELNKTLAANQGLLDSEFLLTLEAVAKWMSEEGNQNNANWLRNLGNQLAESLNQSSSKKQFQDLGLGESDLQAYFQVLMQILQTIEESNGDAKIVYPLFAANTDKFDDILAEILRRWATNKFEEAEADDAEYIAVVIGNFGRLIILFPFGNKASNIEIAIVSYEISLKVFTQEASPQNWATMQNILGAAYKERIKGDKTENIEKAIQLFQAALQVRTQEAFPEEWAQTQHNLGVAYKERIKGDKAENIERAIQFCQAALQVRIQEAFPEEWAETQNSLGAAYGERIKGDKAENIEQMIQLFQAALQVRTQKAFPQEWAGMQNNLGVAYGERIKGDKAENIEKAIQFYQAALQIFTQESFPEKWASAQMNLANSYRERIKGNKAENVEKAIQFCQKALQVFTQEAFPQQWSQTQNILANAYSAKQKEYLSQDDVQAYLQVAEKILQAIVKSNGDAEVIYPLFAANTDKLDDTFAEILRNWAINKFEEVETNKAEFIAAVIGQFGKLIMLFPLGNKASNMEIGIVSYEIISLRVFTQEASPKNWATTQNNLGVAYGERIKGDKTENIEKAIQFYQNALQVRTKEAFPENWAETQNNLGVAYRERIKGDKAENIEKAIQFYQNALQVRTKEAFSENWAETQMNLGVAYGERIKGDKAKNIEQAIQLYQNALQVRTKEAFPENWAETQMNLGVAYGYRIKGDKAKNIEQAIQLYQNVLQVFTQKAFPEKWASVQINLANSYGDRIKGDKAENIEKMIQFCPKALQVFTQEAFPEKWAIVQNYLASAYCIRIKGDKAENIEKAIQFCLKALQVRTQEAFPEEWANTQMNLGLVYKNRIKGDQAENFEKAIQFCLKALQVRTQEAFPEKWAEAQHNLGIVYRNRIKGDKAENIEQAIQFYQNTLQVFTQESFPEKWATTQINFGNAYQERIKGDQAENIEKAIQFYQNALQVYNQESFPEKWAAVQINFGNSYKNRIKGDKAKNFEKAIQLYQNALQVYTQNAFPYNHAETLENLGMLYQEESRFNSAYNTYKSAITTVELLRSEIISGQESKRKQAEKWNKLYCRIVEVCLHLQEETLALEYIERSKTRNLVELILERDSKIIFPPEVVNQLEQLRDEIATGQDKIQNGKAENPTALAQHLKDLRQRKKSLEDEYLPVGSGFDFKKFQASLDKNTTIIEWYIFDKGGFETFIITSDNIQRFNSSISADNLQALIDWSAKYLTEYYEKRAEWINNLASYLTQLTEILNIEEILKLVPQNCSNLILIPHRYLHLFPLHALPLSDGSFLCDKFPDGVSYAPSCQLLQQVNLRKQVDLNSLFAIQNPTEDLAFTNLEVETISSLFTDKKILSKQQATQTALSQASLQIQQANYLHFSCHGTFNPNTPQDSCLILAGADENHQLDLNKCLTLGNLFERDFNLNQCRLVVLSACETGWIDFNNDSDEYIGLPSGFLYAGSSSVVSSLWTVDDLSTSFLMIKFIQILKNIENISVPVALNQAQNWLRNATKEDLQEWAGNLPLDNPLHEIQLKLFINQIQPNSKPFQSPFYWAAFTAVGN